MAISQALAGYTMTQADDFREFLIKKKEEQLFMQRRRFVDGCISNGISEEVALDIWDDLIEYGINAFNKAHATAYSILTYQTAYLKCYYPLEFLCATQNKWFFLFPIIGNIIYKQTVEEGAVLHS